MADRLHTPRRRYDRDGEGLALTVQAPSAAGLSPVTAEQFKLGMRCLAAGVTIVTTVHGGVRSGLTATAVTSLSADPPQVLVCVNRTAGAHDLIHSGSRLCVNVLCHTHQKLAARFAGQNGVFGPERFDMGRWTTLKTGAPVLADALVSFDCVVSERVQASTHTIFIGRVVDVRVRPKARPLVYASGTYARLEAGARRSMKMRRPRPAKA